MKKTLLFAALLAVSPFASAVDLDGAAAQIQTRDTVANNTGRDTPLEVTHTCSVLSNVEPAVTLNLSTNNIAAMACDLNANAAVVAVVNPGGRINACGGARCIYSASSAGGPVTGNASPTGTTAPAVDDLVGFVDTVISAGGGS